MEALIIQVSNNQTAPYFFPAEMSATEFVSALEHGHHLSERSQEQKIIHHKHTQSANYFWKKKTHKKHTHSIL